MLKKICPYCDQTLSGNYCKGCKRFVRKPLLWDVDYYLNERHPESEENCQYHGDLHTGQTLKKDRAGGKGRSDQADQASERIRQKKSLKSKILIIIIIYLVLSFGVTLFGLAKEFYDEVSYMPEPEPETVKALESAWESYEAENGWTDNLPEPETERETFEGEVREEDVVAAGIRCNGYDHFEVAGDEVRAQFEANLLMNGFDEPEMDQYGYNQEMDGTTWYNTTYEYTLVKNGEYQGYADINTDTGDGSLHSIDIVGDTKEAVYGGADTAAKLLTELGLMEWEEDGQALFEHVIESGEEDPDGDTFGMLAMGDVEVSCMLGEDGFCMISFTKVMRENY